MRVRATSGLWIVSAVDTLRDARDVLDDERYEFTLETVGEWIARERRRVARARRRRLRVVRP